MSQRFRYALQPLLQLRQWEANDAIGDLATANAGLGQAEAACRHAEHDLMQAMQATGADGQSAQRFMQQRRYELALAARLAESQQAHGMARERAAHAGNVVRTVQKQLDSLGQDRDRARRQHQRQEQSDAAVIADDHWNLLRFANGRTA